jgi:hypothetical protein
MNQETENTSGTIMIVTHSLHLCTRASRQSPGIVNGAIELARLCRTLSHSVNYIEKNSGPDEHIYIDAPVLQLINLIGKVGINTLVLSTIAPVKYCIPNGVHSRVLSSPYRPDQCVLLQKPTFILAS